MAQNLRAKIPGSDTLVIYDQKHEATRKFVEELDGAGGKRTGVEIAESSREVAEKSVCVLRRRLTTLPSLHMMSMFQANDLS